MGSEMCIRDSPSRVGVLGYAGLVPLVPSPDAGAAVEHASGATGPAAQQCVDLVTSAPEYHLVYAARKIAVRLRVHNGGRCVCVLSAVPVLQSRL